MIATGFLAVADAQSVGSSSTLIYGIIIALITAVVSQAVAWTMRRQQRDNLIADASKKAVEQAGLLLEQYRADLTDSRKEIMLLRERVARLEAELQLASDDRLRLKRELQEAIERRAVAETHTAELQRRIEVLEQSSERRRDA